ncbi:MAG: Asp-tRNA(Asn)/Glu-tRNA(Gln) amidotransferase subunit GatC [Planctomycetota bacterium]
MIDVTDELVAHIARLSRLSLSAEESEDMKSHFEKVLGFVQELSALNLEGVDPSPFANDQSNVFREDEVGETLPIDEALSNAPQRSGASFVVPRIVDAGGSSS